MHLNEAVAQRLQQLLDDKGWKRNTVQKEGGIPRSTVGKILGMKRDSTKLITLYQILQTMGISLKEFFDDPLFDDLAD